MGLKRQILADVVFLSSLEPLPLLRTTCGPNVRFYFYPYSVEYSTKWAADVLL